MTDKGHNYFFGQWPEMPWKVSMMGSIINLHTPCGRNSNSDGASYTTQGWVSHVTNCPDERCVDVAKKIVNLYTDQQAILRMLDDANIMYKLAHAYIEIEEGYVGFVVMLKFDDSGKLENVTGYE